MFYMDIFCNYSLRVEFSCFFKIYGLNIHLPVLGKGFKSLPLMLNQDQD